VASALKFINNEKKLIFFLLTSFIFLFIPYGLMNNIFFPGEVLEISENKYNYLPNCTEYVTSELTKNSINVSKTTYSDVYLIPEYRNIECLGKVVNLYTSADNDSNVLIGYNQKAFKYLGYIFITIFFTIFIKFYKNSKEIYYPLLLILFFDLTFQFFFLYRYVESESEKIYRINDLLSIFLVYYLYKNNSQKLFILIFYFCLIFSYDHLFIFIILFFLLNKNFKFDPKYKNLIIFIPLVQYSLRILGGLFEKLNYLWLSIGQIIYVGKSRYFDAQWAFFSLKCNYDPNTESERIYFSDTARSCPSDFYGPFSNIIKLNSDVFISTNILVISFTIFLLYIYIKLCKLYPNHIFLLAVLMISSPMNFLFHQGNFDIIAIPIVFLSIFVFNTRPFLASLILLLIALVEIHPMSVFIAFIFISLTNKNFKNVISSLSMFLIGFYLIWRDDSELSIRNQYLSGSNFDSEYLDITKTYGITTDFSFLNSYFANFSLIYLSLIFFIFLLIYSEINFRRNKSFNILSEFKQTHLTVFMCYFVWFSSTIFLDNHVYRMHVALPLLFFLFINSKKSIKIAILLTLLLNPVTTILGSLSQPIIIFINRASMYFVYVILFQTVYGFYRSNWFKKKNTIPSNYFT